ncbi:hypothetical protein GBAR_LOCUS31785 [Geodia barretti]|uniref:Death domain-containing protein n=1 Tax=Geodia barretti TaxID=519541 RepID=A0AA35U1H6_GEOBA|nr:hypothetical protein GBAR_LOCUS31785 [Geodia barretti]
MALLKYFIGRDPLASWRRIIVVLDMMRGYGGREAADKIRHLAEPVTDPTLTINNLCHVTSSIEDWRWWGLGGLGEYNHGLGVPDDVMREIRYDAANPTEEDKKTGVLLYFLHNVPSASWERVAGVLYYMEEEKALQAVKEFMTVSPVSPLLLLNNMLYTYGVFSPPSSPDLPSLPTETSSSTHFPLPIVVANMHQIASSSIIGTEAKMSLVNGGPKLDDVISRKSLTVMPGIISITGRHLGHFWTSLDSKKLPLPTALLTSALQKRECLEVWKEKRGREATYRALISAAEEAGDQLLADNIRDMLEK